MMIGTVGLGMFRFLTGSLGKVVDPPELSLLHTVGALTPFIILQMIFRETPRGRHVIA